MVRFIIVRHGLTEFNRTDRYQGQFDTALDPVGVEQAMATAKHICANYHVDAVYASDLSRAVNTARPIADFFGLEVNTDPAFREIDVGEWTLQFSSDVDKNYPELVYERRNSPDTFRFPGGESYAEVVARAAGKLEELAPLYEGKTVLVVSHGGVIRSLVADWMGCLPKERRKSPSIGNASITEVTYEDRRFELTLVGDRSHLPQELK